MSEIGGFRDLLSEFDCLKFEARSGRLGDERFREEISALLRRAELSLDPRVHRLLVPALLASAPAADPADSGVLTEQSETETAEHLIASV